MRRRHILTLSLLLFTLGATPPTRAAEHFVCDCDTDADADCQAGDDAADGATAATPWQTYDQARQAFASLGPGDAIRFCRGGAFEATGGARWVNGACLAGSPCEVTGYAPPWASGDEGRPLLWVRTDQHAFALEDGGDADHEEGYVFRGLELRCTVCDTTGANGFFLYNDIDDVLLEDLVIDGFGIGVHLAGSNPCSADPACDGQNDRLTLRASTIRNSHAQGFLGAGHGTVIEGNHFEANGTRAVFDHNIYYSGAAAGTQGSRIVGNTLYRSAWAPTGSCTAVSLVVHGEHEDLLIEGNEVWEDVGAAEPGCWGIAVDPGYGGETEGFTRAVIRGNTVRNVGNLAIGVASCADCRIENNVIVQEQAFGFTAIAAPDRDRGAEDLAETNVDVRNNSIYVGAAVPSGRGLRVGGEGTGHLVVSNAVHYAGTGSWDCLDLDLPAGDYEAVDYNLCWFPGAANGEWAAGAGTSPDPLSAWQTASGLDAQSQLADPGFTDPTGAPADLSAAGATAALVDRGHPTLSAPTAFGGYARDSSPDVGAYEHGATTPAPDAGVGPDAEAPEDAGPSGPDASGADGGPGPGDGQDSGCGCRTNASPTGATLPWFLVTLIFGLRALRTRRRRHG